MTSTAHPPIKLFQFPRMFGIPNLSPFCCKLETWLRIAGIPYEVVNTPDPRKGPKGKLPFIEDAGVRIADTSLIVDHLVRTRGVDPDARLGASQRATALLVQRTLEEHYAFILAYTHLVRDEGLQHTRARFEAVPALVRPLVTRTVHGQIKANKEGALEPGHLAPLARGHRRVRAARLARSADGHVRRAILLRRRARRARRDRVRCAGHNRADADRVADPRLPEVAAGVCRLRGADPRTLLSRAGHCAFARGRRTGDEGCTSPRAEPRVRSYCVSISTLLDVDLTQERLLSQLVR
jgi:hypothetical protein